MSSQALLDEIEAFVRVVEAGSFTSAAKQLGVPKSTLSRALVRLEDATRVRLLGRSTRSIALTDSGRRFFDRVAPHVAGLRDAIAELAEQEETPHGRLRVTMPVDVGQSLAADLVARFTCRYPRVQVEVDLSGKVVNLLEEGFDIAIRVGHRLKDSSLVARRLAMTEIGLFASPDYLAKRGEPTTIEELSDRSFVLFHPPGSRTDLLGLKPFAGRPRLVTSDFTFLRSVLLEHAGIGPLPVFLARDDVASGRLVRVVPSWSWVGSSLYVVYPSAKHVPRRVAVFRDFLIESFAAAVAAHSIDGASSHADEPEPEPDIEPDPETEDHPFTEDDDALP